MLNLSTRLMGDYGSSANLLLTETNVDSGNREVVDFGGNGEMRKSWVIRKHSGAGLRTCTVRLSITITIALPCDPHPADCG